MTRVDFDKTRWMLAVCSLMSLAGCVGATTVSGIPAAPKEINQSIMLAPKLEPYRLQVGDVLDVKLLNNPELDEQVTVLPDGTISTEAGQDIKAYGHTAGELQKALEARYASALQMKVPHVTVIVRSFAPTRVYVLGEVNAPGEFINVGPNLTLLQALARAGGVKNSAQTSEVLILRRGATENPKVYRASFDAAASGAEPGEDVRLSPYDVVYVPRSMIGNTYLNYQQYFQQFLPIGASATYQINNQR